MKLTRKHFATNGRLLISVARALRARGEKYCPKCRQVHSRDAFSPSTGRYDGLAPHCIKCEPEYQSKRHAARYRARRLSSG